MKVYVLIGAILLLILPFSIIRINVELADSRTTSYYGLFSFSTNTKTIGFENSNSKTFDNEWMQDNGMYEIYFSDNWTIGILIVFITLLALGLAVFGKEDSRLSTILLLLAGLLLLILRFIVLKDQDRFFYKKDDFLGIETVYYEIPVGFFISTIFTALDFFKGKK